MVHVVHASRMPEQGLQCVAEGHLLHGQVGSNVAYAPPVAERSQLPIGRFQILEQPHGTCSLGIDGSPQLVVVHPLLPSPASCRCPGTTSRRPGGTSSFQLEKVAAACQECECIEQLE